MSSPVSRTVTVSPVVIVLLPRLSLIDLSGGSVIAISPSSRWFPCRPRRRCRTRPSTGGRRAARGPGPGRCSHRPATQPAMSPIPGPASRATTVTPRRPGSSTIRMTISPRRANFTMFLAISEIAVAIRVRSVAVNPARAAMSRPCCRAVTTSASRVTITLASSSFCSGGRRSNRAVLNPRQQSHSNR